MSYKMLVQSSRSIAVGETYTFTIETAVASGTKINLTIGRGSGQTLYQFDANVEKTISTSVAIKYTGYKGNQLIVTNNSSEAVTFRQVEYIADNDAYMFGPYKKRVNVKQIDLNLGATTESGGVYSTENGILYLSTLEELGITEDYSMLAVLVAFGTGDAMPDARKYHPPWDVYNNRLYPWVEITDTKTWLTIRYSTTDNAVIGKNVWVKLLFVKMPEGVTI